MKSSILDTKNIINCGCFYLIYVFISPLLRFQNRNSNFIQMWYFCIMKGSVEGTKNIIWVFVFDIMPFSLPVAFSNSNFIFFGSTLVREFGDQRVQVQWNDWIWRNFEKPGSLSATWKLCSWNQNWRGKWSYSRLIQCTRSKHNFHSTPDIPTNRLSYYAN